LAAEERHDEAASLYAKAVDVALDTAASPGEVDVARYLRAQHLLAMKRYSDVVMVAGEIPRQSVVHAPARAVEAVALATLRLPGAGSAAVEAVSSARTAEQRERITTLVTALVPPADELTASLFVATRAGEVDAVARALAGGADIRSRATTLGADAETPLISAAGSGHDAVVALLLSRGAEVNARTTSGWTALMRACNAGHTQCAKLLLDAGADPNLRNDEGYTAYGRIPENLPELLALVTPRGGQP
jgi:hypothetical protein